LAPSFDTVGFFAGDLEVLARVAGVLLPSDVAPPPIRRVLMLEQGWNIADPEI
jgi:amidase